MELTAQVINEVEFSMARRGYDPDQVDEFLEKVAVAVGELNERLADLRDRIGAAERRAQEAERRVGERPERVVAPSGEATAAVSAAAEAELETLKRTLLLAQRTADAAVREAEEEAHRIKAGAEAEARKAHETARREILEEIGRLEAARDDLRLDADALDQHVAAQRSRLQATIADLQRIVDDPSRLPETEPAPTADVTGPADVADVAEVADVAPEPVRAVAAPAPTSLPSPEPEPAHPEQRPSGPAGPFVLAEDETDDDAWARFGYRNDVDDGPRTEPVLRLDRIDRGNDTDDDAYLAELRKAMLDDTGAPGGQPLDLFDDADAGRGARPWFGRRR